MTQNKELISTPAFILEIRDDVCGEPELYVFEREIDAYQGLAYDVVQRIEHYGVLKKHEATAAEARRLYAEGDYLGVAKLVREQRGAVSVAYYISPAPLHRVFSVEAFPYVHLAEAKDD